MNTSNHENDGHRQQNVNSSDEWNVVLQMARGKMDEEDNSNSESDKAAACFPTASQLESAAEKAENELVEAFRKGRWSPAVVPFAFAYLEKIVTGASNASALIRQLTHLASSQTIGQNSSQILSEDSRKYLERFPAVFDKPTGTLRDLDRIIVLLSYRELSDGPTLVRPKVTDFLDSPRRWEDAETALAFKLRRLIHDGGERGSCEEPSRGR